MIHVTVEIQTAKGKSLSEVQLARPEAVLLDLLSEMAQLDWGADLFDPQVSPAKLLPGFLLILENRMVQPWEIEARPIADGQKLKIIQVVPGG